MTRFDKDKYLRKIKLKRFNKYFYLGIVCLFCLIIGLYFTYSKFSVSKDTEVVKTTVGEFLYGDIIVGAYINGEYSSTFPKKDDGYKVEKIICDNNSTGTWNNDSWGIVVSNLTKRTKCNVCFMSDIQVDFDYTGGEQTFTVPVTGTYKLETWGAQGGDAGETYRGGYGSYSTGNINLTKDDIIYINVGGVGQNGGFEASALSTGGYNGGGDGQNNGYSDKCTTSGGGATHIALKSGLLSSLEGYKSDILIVSGGGGGSYYHIGENNKYFYSMEYGDAGGYIGNTGKSSWGSEGNLYASGGLQTGIGSDGEYKGSFGNGANGTLEAAGGGGGLYGGNSNRGIAGGGSGYIGNSILTNKAMYCYNCKESSEESTKTISITCSEEMPTENCAKKGNGYARISLVSNE